MRRVAFISRVVIAFAAALFAGIAVAAWIAPTRVAGYFGLEAIRGAGVISLSADIGGLFAGLAFVCIAALRSQNRAWPVAGAVLIAAIAAGRLIGWVAAGGPDGDVFDLTIELLAVGALAVVAWSLASCAARPVRPSSPHAR